MIGDTVLQVPGGSSRTEPEKVLGSLGYVAQFGSWSIHVSLPSERDHPEPRGHRRKKGTQLLLAKPSLETQGTK